MHMDYAVEVLGLLVPGLLHKSKTFSSTSSTATTIMPVEACLFPAPFVGTRTGLPVAGTETTTPFVVITSPCVKVSTAVPDCSTTTPLPEGKAEKTMPFVVNTSPPFSTSLDGPFVGTSTGGPDDGTETTTPFVVNTSPPVTVCTGVPELLITTAPLDEATEKTSPLVLKVPSPLSVTADGVFVIAATGLPVVGTVTNTPSELNVSPGSRVSIGDPDSLMTTL